MGRIALLFGWCFSLGFGSVSLAGDSPSPNEISRRIDAELERLWAEQGVKPAAICDDATFLRRLSLDLTGTIPTIGEARKFLKDQHPDKRDRLIRDLLGTPQHSSHLAREIARVVLQNQQSFRPQLEDWLYLRLRDGASWGDIATNIIDPSQAYQPGAEVFVTSLESKPERIADATARVFLGLQMGCAECHDHPFGQWTREEFWNYSALFADAGAMQRSEIFGREKTAELVAEQARPLVIPDTNKIAVPQFPGAKEPIRENGKSRRAHLVEWMLSAENPWFAKAAVNRVWSLMFGRGLVEPVDDLTASSGSPANEVLNLLAQDFADHGFDLKRLLEIIAGTRAYQLASHSADEQPTRPELFHVMAVRSLTADQIYACLMQAVSARRPTPGQTQDIAVEKQEFLRSLSAPTQSATEFQSGIPQMLTLLNGPLVARVTDVQKSDLLAGLEDAPFFTDDERIEILYLATLTRTPTRGELRRARAFLAERRKAASLDQELGDLLWVLVNSSEFLLNH